MINYIYTCIFNKHVNPRNKCNHQGANLLNPLNRQMCKVTSKSENIVVSLKKKVGPLSFEPSHFKKLFCFLLFSVSPIHRMAGKQMKGITPSLNTLT